MITPHQGVFASGRAEGTVYFGCFGGNAAKTTEKEGHFLAAAGENARFNSVDFAAKPQNQPKKKAISLLPQAKNARCGTSNHVTA